MINVDAKLLEEAYLSISKKNPMANNMEEQSPEIGTEPNSVVSVGPMDEPAPGIDAQVSDSPASPEMSPSPEVPSDVMAPNLEQEDEEDQMTLDNLNSVRESIVKIAGYCGGGGHLEIWAQQKLAIAMDNLAEIARRLH